MWNWTIEIPKSIAEQIEALDQPGRREIETALQNQYWPQKTLKKVFAYI